MGIAAAVISGFILAAASPSVVRLTSRAAGWLLAIFPLAIFAYFASFLGSLPFGGLTVSFPWAPSLGLSLSFLLDDLSLLFTLLISGVGAIILVYAGGYLAGHPQLGRLFAFLLIFMASMLGLVLADNVLTLFVFWELTSLSSYFLIGFDHERSAARSSALQALLVTGGGGLALLAGLLLLGQAGGDLGLDAGSKMQLSSLMTLGDSVRAHALYLPILFLILAGAFTKSAQFPFHFWLPSAMEAPTPISAYLHSATMVKAGVYLLARLSPILGGSDAWLWTVTGFGAATMLLGAVLAVRETDLKRILAYSTISALGMLMMLVGLGSAAAMAAALAFLLGHALYKGALFLIAGAVDHETGTRDVNLLRGLGKAMPITAAMAALAALSMAGLPPLFGFIAKELALEATLASPTIYFLTGATVVVGMLYVAVAAIVGFRPFFGKAAETPTQPHEAPLSLWLGPVLLAVLSLTLGVFPALADGPLLAPARAASMRATEATPLKLALWHGWNTALALSCVSLAGGIGLFLLRERLRGLLLRFSRWGPAQLYDLALAGLNGLARHQTRLLQSGYLRYYLLTILAATVALVGYTLVSRGRLAAPTNWSDIRFYEAGLMALIALAMVATVRSRSRLAAIAALGVVGNCVALIFVLYGAPDLAMTQFLIETLTVILFVLVFYHLPPESDVSKAPVRLRDAAIALATGSIMTALVLIASQADLHPTISSYFSENSVLEAHGRNVVNVILVDYRSLDTLGEIAVLAVAAVGVYALLKLRPGTSSRSAVESVPNEAERGNQK